MFLPFTNPWMLAALAAVAIPLIIEWLFRRRKRQVELPTIRFLLNNKEQEKIRRQDRILLIMRSVAIFLLVLALARPFVQRGWLGKQRDRKVLVLLDNTASMNQSVSFGTSFSLAQAKAAALIRALPKDGSVTLAVCSVGGQAVELVPPGTDTEAAWRAVSALEPGRGAASIGEGLDWIVSTIKRENWSKTEVYVFSDFQQQTWKPAQQQERVTQALGDLKDRTELFLVDVGGEPKYNLILTGLSPQEPKANRSKRVITTERPVQFVVDIQSVGEVPPGTMAQISLYVDEGHEGTQTINVSEQRIVVFDHTFKSPGEHLVKAVITQGDDFDLDNERLYLCSVPSAYRVLVLDERANEPIPDSFYLLKAVTPTPEVKVAKQTDFVVNSILPAMLADEENLRSYSVIVLTATRSLTPEMAGKLEQWVREGGGLIMFTGPEVNLYDYHRLLFNDNPGRSLLPAKLLAATQPDGEAVPRFGMTNLAGWTDTSGNKDASVLQYMPVAKPLPSGTDVVLSLENGDPLVLRKKYGEGQIVLWTTTAGHEWSYLAAVPQYTMLLQELLVELLGNPDSQVNLAVGGVFRQPVYGTSNEILFLCPDGKSVTAQPKARSQSQTPTTGPDEETTVDTGERYVSFGQTHSPGVYTVDEQVQQVVPRPRFVVNSDSAEADLSRLTEGEFRNAYASAGGRWVQRDESVEQIAATLHSIIELFPALLWGLAALMAGESFLAWRFGRRRGEVPS